MLRLNFQRIQTIVQRGFGPALKIQGFEKSTTEVPSLCKRLMAQYQFRTPKQIYYPDRNAEMKRNVNVPVKRPPMINMQDHSKKSLSKDYYYKVLGVHKHATVQQIRSAFYALAKRYHPDSTHSQEKLKHFQELSNAYNILTDENKRLEYDQLGGIKDEKAFFAQARNPMNLDIETVRKYEREMAVKKEFNKLSSSSIELPLTFVEATTGCKKRLGLRYLRKCDKCNGKSQLLTNREVGREPCRRCNGTGKMFKKTLTFSSEAQCPQCKGKGFINRNDCESCENRGFVVANVDVLIHVPSGSKNGDVIKIENPNTRQQVNYILNVPNSAQFRRVGNDLHTDKFLTVSEAILGGTVRIRGLYEDFDLRIEPGTQSHSQVILPNKGVRTSDGIGKHIITYKVRIPSNLTVKQRQLVLALAQAEEPVFDCQNKE